MFLNEARCSHANYFILASYHFIKKLVLGEIEKRALE